MGAVGVHWDGSLVTADPLAGFNIYNSGNVLNNQIYANNINLNSGSAVQFLGNLGDGSHSTSLNYLGSNSTVTLGSGVTLYGDVTNTSISNSNLVFNGSGTVTGSVGSGSTAIGTVQVNGNSSLVLIGGNLSTDHLDYQAASVVAVGSNLYLDVNKSNIAVNAATFGSSNGVLQVGGSIVGLLDKTVITTNLANTGTVTMLSGTQSISGHVGASGMSIARLNIGGTGSAVGFDNNADAVSNTTVSGNVYAQTVSLNNNNSITPASSSLTMASGYNLTGTVVTDGNGLGQLTLAGGTQTVTGTVGASGASLETVNSGATDASSTFTGAIYATNVNNLGTGTSTYQSAVTATSVGVNAGTSNFQGNLTAVTTTIGTGTGNFNTLGGTTASAIEFSGAGTANLNQGLTGAINFKDQAGTVNLADGKEITGDVVSLTFTGTLNSLGGGTLSGKVGKLAALNVNTVGPTAKTLLAKANVEATSIELFNDGTLQLAASANLTGAVTTAANGTGSLTLLGSSTVTGNVGVSGMALKQVNAGTTGATDIFTGGVVYADKLAYSGNGTVQFNGPVSPVASPNNVGFVGTVDFGAGGSGTLQLGDGVDLITQHAGNAAAATAFVNANNASLRFLGNSVVTGDLGSAASGENFLEIYAGANGKTVTFNGNVYMSAPTTLNVSGTGNINLLGDLNGSLRYQADGTVNVADGKLITSGVTTDTANTGTLNFVGSATTQTNIGDPANYLKAVNFHAATSDAVVLPVTAATATVNIGHNVYAAATTMGTTQNSNGNATIANLTGNVYLGNAVTLASSNVTLNTAGTVTTDLFSVLGFAHTKNADGTLTNTATVTKSSFGTGALTTNGATLNFALGNTAWGQIDGGGLVNSAASSSTTGGLGSTLVMGGNEKVNLSMLGSLRNGQTYTLIGVASGATSGLPNTILTDNSFVIDTALSQVNGSLVVTATRANDVYIAKSGTAGHFSNPAALRLGTLAASGVNYTADLQTVLNKLDINQWGYGNNQANLAKQVQRLAPGANNALAMGDFAAASAVSDNIGMRMQELRSADAAQPDRNKGVWLRSVYAQGTQEAVGPFDGFKSKVNGYSLGLDVHPNRDSVVGLALSNSSAETEQQNFRLGDTSTAKAWHVSLYGAYDFTPALFADVTLTSSNLSTQGNRATVVGRTAQFDISGKQSSGKLNLGYRILFQDSTTSLTPLLSFETSSLQQDDYQETNAGDIGLRVKGQSLTSNQSGLGLRLATTSRVNGMVVKPEFTLMALNQTVNFNRTVSAQFIGDLSNAAAFDTQVTEAAGNSVKATLGMSLLMSETSSLSLYGQYQKTGAYVSNQLALTARWDF